jgi:hypothetical protein
MPRARKIKPKNYPRPIIVSRNHVPRRTAGRLSKPLLWQGRQWSVTGYGVEARDGTYPIPKKQLWERNGSHGWEEHMAEKNWVDMRDFLAALSWARKYFTPPARRVPMRSLAEMLA